MRLFETNLVSEATLLRPGPRVAGLLGWIANEGLGFTSVTVWTVLNGIRRLDCGPGGRDLANQFRDLLDDTFEDRIVGWSLAEAQACTRILIEKRRRGEPLDNHMPNAVLAATATRWLAVVTCNTSEFRNTGVETIVPWGAEP